MYNKYIALLYMTFKESICKRCNESFKSKKDLISHEVEHIVVKGLYNECELCDFKTCDIKRFEEHLISDKHINKKEIKKQVIKCNYKYKCVCCGYYTNKIELYNKHIVRKYHLLKTRKLDDYIKLPKPVIIPSVSINKLFSE